MSGGKGGSTTSSVTVPEYIEAAAQRNLNKAERISQIGYTPYYGPDVAGFTPMQQAGFQNIADTAGAFGMAAPTSQQDIMGGMGPATTYAGGVQGYSSAPIYEQALQTLGERRPGQKAYIDSFFIDPYSGGATAGNFAPIDYTSYGTIADQAAANQSNDLATSQAGAMPATNTGTGFASQQASSAITAPAEGITDTSTAGIGTQIFNDLTEFGTGLASNTLAGNILLGPSYNVGGANNPIETPTIAEMQASAPSGMTYQPSTGSYVTALAPVQNNNNDNKSTAHEEMMKAASSAPVTSIKPISRGDAANGADTGDSGGLCVVATHAVNSGAFSPATKREAVVWCMQVLHGKWWGEAIRRGYRHLGRSKIEQGKAADHYQEFRNYIDFARGKKRTIKGAIHFAARTAQFFAVGLVKKDS